MKLLGIKLNSSGVTIETSHSPIIYHIESPGTLLLKFHDYQQDQTDTITSENLQAITSIIKGKRIFKIHESKAKKDGEMLRVLDISLDTDQEENGNCYFGIKCTLSFKLPIHPNIFGFISETTRILDISIERNIDLDTISFKLKTSTDQEPVSLETNCHLYKNGGAFVYMKSESESRYTKLLRFEDDLMAVNQEWETRWKAIMINAKILDITRINVPLVNKFGYTYDCIRINCESTDYLQFTIEIATAYIQPRLHVEYTKLDTDFLIHSNRG